MVTNSSTPDAWVNQRFKLAFFDDEIAAIIEKVEKSLRSGWLSNGPLVEEFEEKFANMTGTRFAIACSSGSAALEIIFRHLGVGGKKVLVPTNTNFASAASALYAGAQVVLYDNGLYPNIRDLEAKMDGDVAAVVVVHIAGYISPDFERIAALCRAQNVTLIEDAAHAHGATIDGRSAGSLGFASAFSLFPSKVITTGEGGVITTSSVELAKTARRLRNQGKARNSEISEIWGNSWRMTELGAAVGITLLNSFQRDRQRRLDIFQRYQLRLRELPGFQLFPVENRQKISGYKIVGILEEPIKRNELKTRMDSRGSSLEKETFALPLHRQNLFLPYSLQSNFPIADSFCDGHICLPSWRTMASEDVENVSSGISSIMQIL